MLTVHQLVHTLSYGDAISTEVLALKRLLKNNNIQSEIYALHVHPKLKGQAKFVSEFPTNFKGKLILHYSLGSPLNQLYLDQKEAERILIYHNLTPAKWFHGVNPRIVRDIENGLKELPELCKISNSIWSDSEYNASEIEKLGFKSEVLELPFDHEKWAIPTNPGIDQLLKAKPTLNVLHVGRIAPNKCIEDIIKTFYFLHHYIEKNSILWLVGINTDTEIYAFSLGRLIQELALEDAVRFVGCLADEEVKALYENSAVYMCMSEHEGFCLPLVEAMYFGLPVISYASTAIPKTLGDAGILVKEKRHAEIAELIYEIYTNTELRNNLITAGKNRAGELTIERFWTTASSLLGIKNDNNSLTANI
jgi:glycosyltransferase involved in cell wall biosynthesis